MLNCSNSNFLSNFERFYACPHFIRKFVLYLLESGGGKQLPSIQRINIEQ